MTTTTNSVLQAIDKTPTLLITGATGSIGTALIKILSQRSIPFRAMVRSPKDAEKLATLPGADVVIGDFNDATSLARALTGIERAFLLTNSSEQAEAQQLSFVTQAQKAGVRHIVKLSQLAADEESPVRFLRYHAVVEQAIRESVMDFTFLRPNLFMQGLLGFKDSIIEQGKFFAAIGDARISAIDVRDIADVAIAALIESGHEGKIYTLTGPQALTHEEIAEAFSTTLKRPVTFIDVSPEAMRSALLGVGFPIWQADGLLEDYAHYSRNEASFITSDVQNITGNSPRTFATFTQDYAPVFS